MSKKQQLIIAVIVGVGIIGAFGFQQSQIHKLKESLVVYQQVINNQGSSLNDVINFIKQSIADAQK